VLALSSWWHNRGCLQAYPMVGAKCWNQIAEGYLIPNTGEKNKGELHTQGNNVYKGPKDTTNRVINALISSPGGIPKRAIYRGG
jgi:predicted Fe-Mo cluster-binding NifX family protein